MEDSFVEWVYDSLTDALADDYRLPEVENVFECGKPCDILYQRVYDAYERICEKHHVEYDDDVEGIINDLLFLARELGCKMYEYGAKYGMKGKNDTPNL